MDYFTLILGNLNVVVASISSALAVLIGVRLREVGLRTYLLVLLTSLLITAAVIETWFYDASVFKSAAIGWAIGYLADDVILTLESLVPEFVQNTSNDVLTGIKNKINKILGVGDKG